MVTAKKINSYPGITNYVVPVPGSSVIAYLAVRDENPTEWIYSLWTKNGEEEDLIASDQVTLPERFTPEQVARLAFIVEIEYKK